jgi:hypothetical protein
MSKYLELTEVKEELDKRNIKYQEVRENGIIWLYVNGLMQIQEPTDEDKNKFWPYIRVSLSEGDLGYYVRDCGVCTENVDLDEVIELIESVLAE